MSERDRRRARVRAVRWRLLQQAPLVVGLAVLWMLLWGEVTALSVVSGVVVALAVMRVFYLPPVELGGRFNLVWFVVLVARFAAEVVKSSVIVAAQAFRPGRLPLNAIVEVQLRSRSDFVATMTATLVTMVPGSLVLEIDRDRGKLFLHVLAARDAEGARNAREVALRMEAAIVRAAGSRADLERVRA